MRTFNSLLHDRPGSPAPAGEAGRRRAWWWIGAAAATVAGLTARVWPRPALWLDEAQSVHIASHPITSIPDALREDGAPPLYYVVLHVWMDLFGDGDRAVRSLSTLCSLAALAGIAWVGARFFGRRVGVVAFVVTATNPFVIRYATEARMYALVMALVVLGVAVVGWCLERPTVARAAGVALVAAALLYTHYWSLYLVAAVAVVLLIVSRRRRPARVVLGGLAAGGVLWLPWLSIMRYQAEHTATPWAAPASLQSLAAPYDVGGRAPGWMMVVHGVGLTVLVIAALSAPRARRSAFVVPTAAVVALTLLFALAGSVVSDSAYVPRYTSVITPLVLLVAASGARQLGHRLGPVAVGGLALIGLVIAVDEVTRSRTRSDDLVAVLAERARPGDHVVYCPDQLGPAASRLLAQAGVDGLAQSVYPPGAGPGGVDWTDYAERHARARPEPYVDELLSRAGDRDVWLIWSGTYPPTQPACRGLVRDLAARRPDHEELIADDRGVPDHGALWVFTP